MKLAGFGKLLFFTATAILKGSTITLRHGHNHEPDRRALLKLRARGTVLGAMSASPRARTLKQIFDSVKSRGSIQQGEILAQKFTPDVKFEKH